MSVFSPISWFGSKTRLASRIIEYFPNHRVYAEPFGGSAAVLLAKEPAKIEIYNDYDQELVNFFLVLRDPVSFAKLRRAVESTPYARAEFQLAKERCDDSIESARRFIVRYRQSRMGLGKEWNYCVNDVRAEMPIAVKRWRAGIGYLPEVHKRFQNIQIECADWRTIISRYDGPETLFYVDPPYHPDTRIGGGYRHELTHEDHRELVGRLLATQGMIVLSCYDHQAYEPLGRAAWRRVHFDVPACSSTTRTRRTETIWISPSVANREENRNMFLTPTEKMREGAYRLHSMRVASTTKKVTRAIARLRATGKKPKISSVARAVRMSREHLSRKYGYLLKP
jgi:DNA adenine methylase